MNILLIGCGKMGGALLERWKSGPEKFTIVDPMLKSAPDGVNLIADRSGIADQKFDVIVVAIKPQMIDEVVPAYADSFAPGGYLLSIAAGCSIDRLKKVSNGQPVVRVMPNLPAAIGMGVNGLCPSADLGEGQAAHAIELMKRAGTVIPVESEDGLDRVTAIAGSGPGYVFEIARTYVEAAKGLGFSDEDATAMVLETMQGAIAMAQQSELSLQELRNSVTSKNGTTAAGLGALNGGGELTDLLSGTLRAAYDRAIELR